MVFCLDKGKWEDFQGRDERKSRSSRAQKYSSVSGVFHRRKVESQGNRANAGVVCFPSAFHRFPGMKGNLGARASPPAAFFFAGGTPALHCRTPKIRECERMGRRGQNYH
jgi:hypothetical protein